MVLAIVFMILVGYTNMGLWDEYGPSKLPWYIYRYGVPIIFTCAGICLVSTFTLQALVDFVFKVGDRNETD